MDTRYFTIYVKKIINFLSINNMCASSALLSFSCVLFSQIAQIYDSLIKLIYSILSCFHMNIVQGVILSPNKPYTMHNVLYIFVYFCVYQPTVKYIDIKPCNQPSFHIYTYTHSYVLTRM